MMDISPIIKNANKRYSGENLRHYFKMVMEAPNANAPYHNLRHMTHVCWEAYDGGVHMGLSPRKLRNLLIAALWHDYDHTAIKNDDQVNIDRAIRALDIHALEEDREHLLDIRNCIRATKYPYGPEIFTEEQLILRDADQSQTFSLVWMQSLSGLALEMEMSHKDMLLLQRPFMEKIKFHTLWGQNKFIPMIPMHLKRVDDILDIIQSNANE